MQSKRSNNRLWSAGSTAPTAVQYAVCIICNESTPLAHTLLHLHQLLNFFLNFSLLLAYFFLPFMSLASFTSKGTLTFLIFFLDPQAVLLHPSFAACPCFHFFFALPFGSFVHWEAPCLGKQTLSWNSWSDCPTGQFVPQLSVFTLKISQLLGTFFPCGSFQGNSS